MHRSPKLPGCKRIHDAASIAPLTLFDFLTPAIPTRRAFSYNVEPLESLFYSALSHAATCHVARASNHTQAQRWSHYHHRRSNAARIRHVCAARQCRMVSTKTASKLLDSSRIEELGKLSAKSTQTGNPWSFFDSNTLDFASKTRLPVAFFHDVDKLQKQVEQPTIQKETGHSLLEEQMLLLKSVRELEDKLARAKHELNTSMERYVSPEDQKSTRSKEVPIILSREDYKNLVDLYYHSMRTRFDPENSDYSPTPKFLDDYTFKLTEDFAPPQAYANFYNQDKDYRSPLEEIEKHLKGRTLREIRVTQVFLDLLLDDKSSNAALFEAYKSLPKPGVAFLPRGTVRVFLQRMSTPWQKNETTMIRYLSLIDEMQEAGLPITQAEWASAIYLAGRSFKKVTQQDVVRGFQIWKQMENEAGVKAHNVTFNILFDLAVRSDMYVVAQKILKEMHDRGLRLNRLGRVSAIYYHGLRKDGDAVRKAYRDFVDAGEIVDTVVLNCVIASLQRAGEPSAAEQIYERMKSLYSQLHVVHGDDGKTTYFKRYPGPGGEVIDRELASNHLNRVLLFSARLKNVMPDHHKELQDSMPLIPDHTTFRTMIAYHANVSGNLDRIVFLMNDMVEVFGLPFQSMTFQLLFKGFALYGGRKDLDSTWTTQRLATVWHACWNAIKDRQAYKKAVARGPIPTLPSMKEVNQGVGEGQENRLEGNETISSPVKSLKRLSTWNDFVIDLAVFPRERRKHIERVHSQLFDEEDDTRKSIFGRTQPEAPKEQETYYAVGDQTLDSEEGEYVLPPPSQAISPHLANEGNGFESPFFPERATATPQNAHPTSGPSSADIDSKADTSQWGGLGAEPDRAMSGEESGAEAELLIDGEPDSDTPPEAPETPHQVRASRTLVSWLLRAYTRCTGSRAMVEEVYNQVRKVWRPHDVNEREMVLRVLRRCLRDCDVYGPPSRLSNDRDRIGKKR